MSILARYRKRGGFRQLLELIESSPPAKKEKLLKVIEQEDPAMANEVQAKCLTPDKVLSWKPETLHIITRKMSAQYFAILCKVIPDQIREAILEQMDPQIRKQHEETISNTKEPLAGEIIAAYGNMFKIIRHLDEERELILSQIDPRLTLPDAA